MRRLTLRSACPSRPRPVPSLSRYVYLLLGISSVACGAATALDFDPPSKAESNAPAPEPKPEDQEAPSQEPKTDQPGAQKPRAGESSAIDLPTFELPDCRRGARPNTVSECPYLADGLCYDDVASACACVCPRGPETFCFEGLFLNIWNGIDVWCAAL
jgi:hypothetical protein